MISCSQAAHEAIPPDGENGGGNKAESPLSLAFKASAKTKLCLFLLNVLRFFAYRAIIKYQNGCILRIFSQKKTDCRNGNAEMIGRS